MCFSPEFFVAPKEIDTPTEELIKQDVARRPCALIELFLKQVEKDLI